MGLPDIGGDRSRQRRIALKEPAIRSASQLGYVLAGALIASLISACGIGAIRPSLPLPAQHIEAESRPGTSRVILFNESDATLYGLDGSGKVNAFLGGENLATIKIGQYVQVDLEPNDYILTLKHLDIVTFTSTHVLKVRDAPLFVKFSCTPTSHSVRPLRALPKGFLYRY